MSSWPDVLSKLATISRSAWQVVLPQKPVAFDGEVIDILFANDADKEIFRAGGTNSPSEVLRRAIFEVIGVRVKYRAATATQPQMVTEPIAKVEPEVTQDTRNKLIDTNSQIGDAVLRDILGAAPVEGDD